MTKRFIFLVLIVCSLLGKSQQNHTLFLWHDVYQSNLVNPAVPISCKWYIGIPVLSSVHANFAHSSFSFNQLFPQNSSGVRNPDLEGLEKRLHYRNYIGGEFHTQLFGLGYKYNEYSFVFTITEKINLPITYPKQIVDLLLSGNASYVGKKVGSKGMGLYFNYYREYALGVSKDYGSGLHLGAKAKLLFGKLNISTPKVDIGLTTQDPFHELYFEGELLVNSSLPIIVDASNSQLNSVSYNDASPIELLFNRKNPGFAVDAGIIYPWTKKIELSASIIDLGFIRWRSNLNQFSGSGDFTFQGITPGILNSPGYFDDLQDQLLQGLNFEVNPEKYTTFLPPRLIAGANYKHNKVFSGGVTGDAIIYRTKTMPSLTFVGQAKPFYWLGFVGSYTIQNYALNNLGAGLFIGKAPVQFYIVSDNTLAFFKPLNARMANIRFGLNINVGCSQEDQKKGFERGGLSNCNGVEDANNKKFMKNFVPWSKRKKK